MGLHSSPAPGRPTISARQAGKLLRRDHRTVQRMIEEGQLEGGCQLINERRRWFIYSDQIGDRPRTRDQADHEQLTEAVAALQDEVAAARATAASVQETNRLLLANQAIMLNALNDYRQASEEAAVIADDYQTLIKRHSLIAARYRRSADGFAQALGNYRDIVGQGLTPDDLSTLDDSEPTG